jgi:hypothetical protein
VLAFMFPKVMDCAYIRVVQNGRGPRFTQEPFDVRSIPADLNEGKMVSGTF